MNFKDQIFVNPNRKIFPETQVVFVADMFVDEYVGGAELTSEALIQTSPFTIQKVKSKDVNVALLSQGVDKFWIFGNFSQLNPELIPTIVSNLKYSILEYDYKYCRFRSPEKHQASLGQSCDCHDQMNGKLVSAFYYGSTSLWWMSEAQKDKYVGHFPFLAEKDNFVLSSVFSTETLRALKSLRENIQPSERKGWLVLGSNSWVKGFEAAKKWCEENNKIHKVIWDLPYEQALAQMASSEGFVYLPAGADTCPRMVIEAKLLGCELHINENVQHSKEEWFDTEDLQSIHDYLAAAPGLFWNAIRTIMELKPKISGYTTTYNCISQGYPFVASITSMLQFCDEVCIVDGGSSDGTWELLQRLETDNNGLELGDKRGRLKIKQIPRDWNHPRFAVFDGMQKAEARKMCTGDFCWQMDSDEIVHEDDTDKVLDICSKMPKNVDIVSLPVVEYWGGPEKVRCDIQPWKWRLSRNKPYVTHGIPIEMRKKDLDGNIFAAEGTDGCDMIHSETGERLPHVTFHNAQSEALRRAASSGNPEALQAYQNWFNNVIQNLPGVHHYSWYDMPRKIKTYKGYWTRHWNSLYDKSIEDTSDNNMFFDLPWSKVTEEMIQSKASELKEATGGWIWHRKWTGEKTPHIVCYRSQPKVML